MKRAVLSKVLPILAAFCMTHCQGARITDNGVEGSKLTTTPDKALSSWLPGLLASWGGDSLTPTDSDSSTPPPAAERLPEDADDWSRWKDQLWTTQAPTAATQLPDAGILVRVSGGRASRLNGDSEPRRQNQRPWLGNDRMPVGGTREESDIDAYANAKENREQLLPAPSRADSAKEFHQRMASQPVTFDHVTGSGGSGHRRITRGVTERTRDDVVTHDEKTRSEPQHTYGYGRDSVNYDIGDSVKDSDAANHPVKITPPTQAGYDPTAETREQPNLYEQKAATPAASRTRVIHVGGQEAVEERPGTSQGGSLVTRPQGREESLGNSNGLENDEQLGLEALVLNLQSQLHESRTSQVRTRSVLNTLEERQAAMERDILTLKENLREVKAQQHRDRQSIETMTSLIEDNAWGVANIKTNQYQLTTDFQGLKAWLEMHNDTLMQLEEGSLKRELMQLNQGSFLQRLNSNIQEVAEAAKEDRHALNRLKHHMHQKLNQVLAQAQVQARSSRVVINVPESANGTELDQYLNWERRAAALEEMSNTVEHQLQELNKKEADMESRMATMNVRVGQYDTELSRIYTLFYNLSLKMSSLENKILNKKQEAVESEMSNLQQSFLNFTQQLMSIEQHHAGNRHTLNNTSVAQGHMTQMLGHHDDRLSAVETLLQDHQSHTKLRHNKVSHSLTKINDTVLAMRQWMEEHRSKASNVFQNVDQELETFRDQMRAVSDRLLQVEVKVLNASLEKCQKTNSDLHQDMKLSDFSSELSKMGGRIGDHSSQLNRLDRGMSQLFRKMDTVTDTTTSMLDDITDVLHLMPQVAALQREVNNLLLQLPTDCKDVALSTGTHHSALYLLKPGKLPHAALTYCEFDRNDNDVEWTYIQRRDSGSVTFDRTWQEYKDGFGSPDTEFWIGNNNLHLLTSKAQYMLQIDMWDLQDQYIYAQYDHFRVEDAATNFRLHIDGYHGNATDSLKYANYMPFSTPDTDNDFSSTHCAKFYTAGWWYKHCHYGNLNGRYTVGVVWFNQDLDEWVQLKKTVMKLHKMNETALYNDAYAGV